jgi:hypothetical protein
MNYSVYDKTTGLIRFNAYSSTVVDLATVELPSELAAIEGELDGPTTYITLVLAGDPPVLTPTPTPRPANPTTIDKTSIAADGVDAFTLSGYPAGATVFIRGPVEYVGSLTAGSDSFQTTLAGTYTVLVMAFPNQDKEFTVNAS